jgi:copper(I)-binding protein
MKQYTQMLRVMLAGLFMLSLVACAPIQPSQPAAEPPPQGVVSLVMGMARASAPMAQTAAAYVTIFNGTDSEVRLASVDAGISDEVSLHETVEENGVMSMVEQPEGFPIPAQGTLAMKPGGKHIMFMGLNQELKEGESLELVLNFADGTSLPVELPVVSIAAMPMADHAHDDAMGGEHGGADSMGGSEAWKSALAELDIAGIHQIDEVLAAGEIKPEFVETVRSVRSGFDAIAWPEMLQTDAAATSTALAELETALDSGDLAGAAAAAKIAHDALHALEHAH